jgi:hypothetical protein
MVLKHKSKTMKSFGTKVQKVSQTITPFGGISFVNNVFNQVGLSKLIDSELGIRVHGMDYRYSEIIRNLFNIFFCGFV